MAKPILCALLVLLAAPAQAQSQDDLPEGCFKFSIQMEMACTLTAQKTGGETTFSKDICQKYGRLTQKRCVTGDYKDKPGVGPKTNCLNLARKLAEAFAGLCDIETDANLHRDLATVKSKCEAMKKNLSARIEFSCIRD